jgi:adenine-specific DNA-methyltransferase
MSSGTADGRNGTGVTAATASPRNPGTRPPGQPEPSHKARTNERSSALTPSALDSIILGDCLEMLRAVPEQSVDLIVSSPPYNIGKEYEDRQHLTEYLGQQRMVLSECVRVLKTSGSLFWQVGAYSNSGILIPLDVRFFPIIEDLGMYPRNRIVWVRQHGLHGRNKFSARHETILWFTKSNDYKFFLDPIRVPQKYQDKKAWRGEKRGS